MVDGLSGDGGADGVVAVVDAARARYPRPAPMLHEALARPGAIEPHVARLRCSSSASAGSGRSSRSSISWSSMLATAPEGAKRPRSADFTDALRAVDHRRDRRRAAGRRGGDQLDEAAQGRCVLTAQEAASVDGPHAAEPSLRRAGRAAGRSGGAARLGRADRDRADPDLHAVLQSLGQSSPSPSTSTTSTTPRTRWRSRRRSSASS